MAIPGLPGPDRGLRLHLDGFPAHPEHQRLDLLAGRDACVSFFPTAFLFGMDAWSLPGLLTPLVAIYCMVVAVWVFRRGLRRYESTGH